ncbi:hypothetical protein ACTMTJ_25735 [Phytohabitans sp. LJ34]|uniref:hypothetical protein n=1 Tax=Phytohabitans sp. LJ34 TaxID=3452217 RepID=UPI003F8B93AB
MSHRVKDLLDEACAGIEPRSPDPVAAVVRRGRAGRVRAIAAAALAVVTVLTGGTVAGTRLLDNSPPEPATETTAAAKPATRPDRPPAPREVKGRVVAGNVSLAVPDGWKVYPPYPEYTPPPSDPGCGAHYARTVLVGEGGNPDGPPIWCTTGEIEVQSLYDFRPYVYTRSGDATTPIVPPRMMTLDGGESAWLRTDADGVYWLVLPWSRVEVRIRAGADLRQQVLDSLETGRWATAALALPLRAEYAKLTVSTDAERAREHELTDQAKVRRAMELLRQAPKVAQGDSCAREDQPTVELEIGLPPGVPAPPQQDFVKNPVLSSFLIGLADGCHEVVSEEGGRVRLDGASLAELGDLFGVELP